MCLTLANLSLKRLRQPLAAGVCPQLYLSPPTFLFPPFPASPLALRCLPARSLAEKESQGRKGKQLFPASPVARKARGSERSALFLAAESCCPGFCFVKLCPELLIQLIKAEGYLESNACHGCGTFRVKSCSP